MILLPVRNNVCWGYHYLKYLEKMGKIWKKMEKKEKWEMGKNEKNGKFILCITLYITNCQISLVGKTPSYLGGTVSSSPTSDAYPYRLMVSQWTFNPLIGVRFPVWMKFLKKFESYDLLD